MARAKTPVASVGNDWGNDWVERYENLTRHVDEQMDDINRLMAERNEAIERLKDLLAAYDKDVALLRANGFLAPGQHRAAGQRAATYLQRFEASSHPNTMTSHPNIANNFGGSDGGPERLTGTMEAGWTPASTPDASDRPQGKPKFSSPSPTATAASESVSAPNTSPPPATPEGDTASSGRERLVQAIRAALHESRWGHDQMDEEYLANFVVEVVLRELQIEGDQSDGSQRGPD